MNQTEADRYRARSRQAFDAQAATFDVGTEGSHARMLYPHVVEAVTASVAGIEGPRLLDLGCGTGALAERVIESAPTPACPAWTSRPTWWRPPARGSPGAPGSPCAMPSA